MDTTIYQLRLDAVLDAASNCLVLNLRGATAPLPSSYSFYTGTLSSVQVTVYMPAPGGSLVFAGSTYADTDNNKIIVVQCTASGEYEIEAFMPPTVITKPVDGPETMGETSLRSKPQAPSTRVKLVPKIGYPPSGDGDT
jgi:hypothetical protein